MHTLIWIEVYHNIYTGIEKCDCQNNHEVEEVRLLLL